MLTERPGHAVMRIVGEAVRSFEHEGGMHHWEGAQTGTLSVTVLPEPAEAQLALRRQDMRWQSTPGGGLARAPGVIITHPPSGLTVCCDGGDSEALNRQLAVALLRARIWANAGRGRPVPQRVRRTVRVTPGEVVDHLLGQTWPLADYIAGAW